MVKRPPFEEANYPPPESKSYANMIITAIVIAAIMVVAVYGYNHWWTCENWGWLKFCGSIQKP